MAYTSHLWGFFFYRDTYMIPVLIVPQIFMSTKQKCHGYYLLSHFFLFLKIIPIIWSNKNWCKLAKMSEVFDYILECLQKLLPEFKIANAVIHFDEASPHMHVVGVPVWEGAKCGLSKKVSKRNVFTPQTLSVIYLSVT